MLLLISLSMYIIPIEGESGISTLKVVIMSLSSIMLVRFFWVSKAFFWGGLYWIWCLLMASLYPERFRWSSILYMLLFILSYISYYNALYKGIFTRENAIKLIRGLLIAYFVTLIIQQGFALVFGMRIFWPLNLTGAEGKPNMLALEVSHAARYLTVFFVCLARLYELEEHKILTLRDFFHKDKYSLLMFLYAMITMGSGTAFVGLPIALSYFIPRRNVLLMLGSVAIVLFFVNSIEFEPMERAKAVLEASMSGDIDVIGEADGSALYRVAPMYNTIFGLDLTTASGWFGSGMDTATEAGITESEHMIGGIADYGFLSYLIALVLLYSTSIKRVFSIETAIFIILLSANISNGAYIWLSFMLFATTRYFKEKLK